MKALVEMENSGLVALLRDDKYEDLSRMYALFRRVEGGLQLIRTVMADHIKDMGRQHVQVGAEPTLIAIISVLHRPLSACGS